MSSVNEGVARANGAPDPLQSKIPSRYSSELFPVPAIFQMKWTDNDSYWCTLTDWFDFHVTISSALNVYPQNVHSKVCMLHLGKTSPTKRRRRVDRKQVLHSITAHNRDPKTDQ
jgi:hypothetical protein